MTKKKASKKTIRAKVVDEDAIEIQIEECSKQINYYINEYTVGYLADEMAKDDPFDRDEAVEAESGNFYIPDYQRKFVWDDNRISRFIESIIMGLPIPFIFYYENTNSGKLEIVDGSQRLRSIHAFIHKGFTLTRLERLTELTNRQFEDLSESRQRKIRNKSIRGIVLNEHADAEARQDLFNRINTGSKIAEPAEIRRGSLQGPFMSLIISLAEKDYFIDLTPTRRGDTREREELVTRFFAYGDGLEGYDGYVDVFLSNYIEKMNTRAEKEKKLLDDYENRFKRTMDYVASNFPLGFRKTASAIRVTRARFESIAIGSWKAIQSVKNESSLHGKVISDWINDIDYQNLLRADGGNVPTKLRARIEYVQNKLIKG